MRRAPSSLRASGNRYGTQAAPALPLTASSALRVSSNSRVMRPKMRSRSAAGLTSAAYSPATSRSAFATPMAQLSTSVRKNDHPSYMARYIRRHSASRSAEASALPMPYQLGIMKRVCVQLNTHGIARRSSSSCSPLRWAGREAIGILLMERIGVAWV